MMDYERSNIYKLTVYYLKMSSFSAGNTMSASYVTGQSSHLSTDISYSWESDLLCLVNSKELETTGMVIRLFE